MLKQSDFYILIREKELMWAFWIQRRRATGVVIGIVLKAGDTGDAGSTPGSGRPSGGGNGIHSSVLACEIPWTVHSVTKSWAHRHMHSGLSLTLPLPSFQGFGS